MSSDETQSIPESTPPTQAMPEWTAPYPEPSAAVPAPPPAPTTYEDPLAPSATPYAAPPPAVPYGTAPEPPTYGAPPPPPAPYPYGQGPAAYSPPVAYVPPVPYGAPAHPTAAGYQVPPMPTTYVAPRQNTSAIVLTIVAGIMTVSCYFTLIGVVPLILGIVAMTRQNSDWEGSQRLSRIGWIVMAVLGGLAVASLIFFMVVGVASSSFYGI